MSKFKFDELYDHLVLKEAAFNNEQSPLEQTGAGEYNDDINDFPPEGSEEGEGDEFDDEEVDVATELRMIIDRLEDVYEKISGGADEGEGEGEEDMGLDTEATPGAAFEAARSQYKPLSKKGGELQSKNNKVKSKFTAKKRSVKCACKPGEDGKREHAKATTLGPNAGTKAPGNSPANKAGSDLFD